MRDVEIMAKLLEKMAAEDSGFILMVRTMGMSTIEQNMYHNAELLVDAGLATWISESGLRITNDGHDFLNALEQDRVNYIDKAKSLLENGKSLISVVRDIISITDKL